MKQHQGAEALAETFIKDVRRGEGRFEIGETVNWTDEAILEGINSGVGDGPYEAISSYGLPGPDGDSGETSMDIWIGLQKTVGDKKLVYVRSGKWRDLDEIRAEHKEKAGRNNIPMVFAAKWLKKAEE